MLEVSQPRSNATIDRQQAIIEVEGRGFKDRK